MPSTDRRLVVLKGGVSVPLDAYLLLLSLEARGIATWREGDRVLLEPADRLTADDDRALRTWKPHLLTLLAYDAPLEVRPS
ncbi:MAG: hypothetical protein IT180_10820 [Acidobacteria bacterium]|nr:hypothetical protein [Acidobacteriota bacterium]